MHCGLCSAAHMKRADADVTITMRKIFVSLDGKSIRGKLSICKGRRVGRFGTRAREDGTNTHSL